MEPDTQEAVQKPPAAGEDLLAELRQNASRQASYGFGPKVPLRLTIDQASFLYEKLRRVSDRMPEPSKGFYKKTAITNPSYLLEVLEDRLCRTSSTTPTSSGPRKVRFLKRVIELHLHRHARAYLMAILKNRETDELRKQERDAKRFTLLEVAERAEDGPAEEAEDERPGQSFFRPTHHENPDAQLRRAMLRDALNELPAKLRMAPQELHELFAQLTESGGNVSEAARKIGQPQRKTARRIERMIRHLKSRGFSA